MSSCGGDDGGGRAREGGGGDHDGGDGDHGGGTGGGCAGGEDCDGGQEVVLKVT